MTAIDPLVPLRILIVEGSLSKEQLAGEWMQRSVAQAIHRGLLRRLRDGQLEVTVTGREFYRALVTPSL